MNKQQLELLINRLKDVRNDVYSERNTEANLKLSEVIKTLENHYSKTEES